MVVFGRGKNISNSTAEEQRVSSSCAVCCCFYHQGTMFLCLLNIFDMVEMLEPVDSR